MTGDLPAEVWDERDVAATLSPFDLGSETRSVELVVTPVALRGRDGGADIELGPEGGPANALRTNGGGSSHAMVCVTGDRTHALTSEGADASEDGTGRGAPNSNPPGRRQEDDVNLVAFDYKAGGDSTSSGAFEDGTGITPTLGGARPHAIGSTRNGDTPDGVVNQTTVRRLTPTECERLQGFPDGHTRTSNGQPQADSAQYRQMGNSVAVPVFEWLFGRIVQVNR
jgi:DNA (cytosine-5)-methyltransferase 1